MNTRMRRMYSTTAWRWNRLEEVEFFLYEHGYLTIQSWLFTPQQKRILTKHTMKTRPSFFCILCTSVIRPSFDRYSRDKWTGWDSLFDLHISQSWFLQGISVNCWGTTKLHSPFSPSHLVKVHCDESRSGSMVKVEFLMWFKIMEELAMTSCCGLGNGSSTSSHMLCAFPMLPFQTYFRSSASSSDELSSPGLIGDVSGIIISDFFIFFPPSLISLEFRLYPIVKGGKKGW